MKKYWFMASFFFSWALSPAQTNDSFSDGELFTNPTWSGSTAQFIINATQQLQLNSTLAGTSFLSTDFSASSIDDFEWRLYLNQNLCPFRSKLVMAFTVRASI